MKEFIEDLSNKQKIKRKDLLEKDVLIHKILLDLCKHDFFSKNFVFKGGTCLIKCYLGYYRFSEDIDLTWIDQSIYKNESGKQVRRIISDLKDKVGKILEKISKNREFDFILDKDNRRYMEYGGGNKFVTFKIWYKSEILKKESFVKLQINFVEDIRFSISKRKAIQLIEEKENKEFEILYENDYKDYSTNVKLLTYDVREILCEKVRAILTRRGIKARDFVDIYLICSNFNLNLDEYNQEILDKTKFMLDLYDKYQENIREKIKFLNSDDFFRWGTEKDLLLEEIDAKQFNQSVKQLQLFLRNISKKLI